MQGYEKNMTPHTKAARPSAARASASAGPSPRKLPQKSRKPAGAPLQPADYLKKILTARVYDVAVESALEPAKNLSLRLKNTVLLKREDQQPVFSFKLRGAYNKMAHLSKNYQQTQD